MATYFKGHMRNLRISEQRKKDNLKPHLSNKAMNMKHLLIPSYDFVNLLQTLHLKCLWREWHHHSLEVPDQEIRNYL